MGRTSNGQRNLASRAAFASSDAPGRSCDSDVGAALANGEGELSSRTGNWVAYSNDSAAGAGVACRVLRDGPGRGRSLAEGRVGSRARRRLGDPVAALAVATAAKGPGALTPGGDSHGGRWRAVPAAV